MGSKEEDVPTEPAEKPLFVEDMNESELASAVSKLGVASRAELTKESTWWWEVTVSHLLSHLLLHCCPTLPICTPLPSYCS
jgi:hypothetical protein